MKQLKEWEAATEELTQQFVKDVFPDYDYDDDCWWVGNVIGTVINIGDYWVTLDRIVEYYRYKATPKQFFEYYDYEFDRATNGVNFKSYLRGAPLK